MLKEAITPLSARILIRGKFPECLLTQPGTEEAEL